MDEHSPERDRDRIHADADLAPLALSEDDHVEWMIDEAVKETFPASDSPTAVQPGSSAGRRARAAAGK